MILRLWKTLLDKMSLFLPQKFSAKKINKRERAREIERWGAGRRPINYRKLKTHLYPFQCMTFSDSVSVSYSVCVCVTCVHVCKR